MNNVCVFFFTCLKSLMKPKRDIAFPLHGCSIVEFQISDDSKQTFDFIFHYHSKHKHNFILATSVALSKVPPIENRRRNVKTIKLSMYATVVFDNNGRQKKESRFNRIAKKNRIVHGVRLRMVWHGINRFRELDTGSMWMLIHSNDEEEEKKKNKSKCSRHYFSFFIMHILNFPVCLHEMFNKLWSWEFVLLFLVCRVNEILQLLHEFVYTQFFSQ